MTREELRDYVDEQRTLNNIPYHVYSALIDGIDTLEQEPKTGHWIETSRGFECDQCHGLDTDGLEPPYCKWCGIKMKGDIK